MPVVVIRAQKKQPVIFHPIQKICGCPVILMNDCRAAVLGEVFAGAGIGLHAAWNGLAGLSAVASLQLFGESAAAQALGMAVASIATGLLVVTFVVAIALLAAFTARLRREGSASA